VDRGERTVRVDVDGVVGIGAERGDEEWGSGMVEVCGPGDGIEEAAVNEFLQ